MRYDSARDPQLVGLLRRAAGLFLLGTLLLGLVAARLSSDLAAMLAAVCLVLGWGCVWTLRVTWYEITDDRLRIRSGPSRLAIRHSDLRRLQVSPDRRNAPALSFDRLRVDYDHKKGARQVWISPADRAAFLQALRQATGLVEDGEGGLQRPPAASPTDTHTPDTPTADPPHASE